jgi:phage terminase small subunit
MAAVRRESRGRHSPIHVSRAEGYSRPFAPRPGTLEQRRKRDIITGMADITPKQEAFALAFLETGNAAEAYRRAYDVAPDAKDGWLYVEACQLLDNPKVALRLKDLRAQAERLSIFNLSAAMAEFEEARELARASVNPSAMVAATTGKVKLFGLDKPTKIEHAGKDGGAIQTEDVSAKALLKAHLDAIASRTASASE